MVWEFVKPILLVGAGAFGVYYVWVRPHKVDGKMRKSQTGRDAGKISKRDGC